MFKQFPKLIGASCGLALAASCLAVLPVSPASACEPVTYCSIIRVCSQAPAPWGQALRKATIEGDPLVIMGKTEDCVRRSNFQGIGKYAKDWNRISDCGAYPERYLKFADAAKSGTCAGAR